MRWLYKLPLRFRSLFKRRRVEQELSDELRFHLEKLIEERVAKGMTPKEARYAALRELGGVELIKEECRDMRQVSWIENLIQDVRYGLRMLAKAPGFSAVAVLTLALGIGLDTGVFTVVNGALFRSRNEKDPVTFVQLVPKYSGEFGPGGLFSTSLADFLAFRALSHSVTDLAAWTAVHATLDDGPQLTVPLLVTCDFFPLYGLERPQLGRLFLPGECSTPGTAPVAVISDGLWRNRYLQDGHIIGRVIRLNGRPFTVVGVTPAGYSGDLRGGIWIPYTMQAQFWNGEDRFRDSTLPWLNVEGRLRPGYSRSAALAELNTIARQQDRLVPGRETRLALTNGSLFQDPTTRPVVFWPVLLIMGALTLFLLIACGNVTMLLLSRAVARRPEMAIRLSLGAQRSRLLRMLLTESLLLAVAAGALSLYLASWVPIVIRKMIPSLPQYPMKLDWQVLAYLFGVTALAALVACLMPAIESSRQDLSQALKAKKDRSEVGSGEWRSRDLLVAGQVAMSLVLLVGAGLFLRAQYQAYIAGPGFETRQVLYVPLAVHVPPVGQKSTQDFYRTLEERIRALPGVNSVSFASSAPLGNDQETGSANGVEVRLPGETKGAGRRVAVTSVSADYFATLGIPILHGRVFRESEAASNNIAHVAVVSRAMSQAFWPGKDPLGESVVMPEGDTVEVVGVARDTESERFGAVDGPHLYRLQGSWSARDSILVRFSGNAQTIQFAVRETLQNVDGERRGAPQTLNSLRDEMASRFWVLVKMVLFLAAASVLLAVVGIYAAVAYATSRRSQEFGIRIALGATKLDVIRLVLGSTVRTILVGLLAGLSLALAGSWALSQVYKHTPLALDAWDPVAYVCASALLAVTVLVAMFGPALRATKVDPMAALRHE